MTTAALADTHAARLAHMEAAVARFRERTAHVRALPLAAAECAPRGDDDRLAFALRAVARFADRTRSLRA